MAPAAIVIAKDLVVAKGRLAPILSPGERRELTAIIARSVLEAVASCTALADRLMVSPDAKLLAMARDWGLLGIMEERPAGMNEAFRLGIDAAHGRGCDGVLLLPADLPLLRAEDIFRVSNLLTKEGGVVVVPSPGGGTSLLGLRPPTAIPLHFEEPASDRRHREEALERDLPVAVLGWPEGGLDLDGPEDLARLWATTRPSTAKDYLRSIGHGPEAVAP